MPNSKTDLVLDSIRAVLQALATMPTSPEARALADRALACERTVNEWATRPTTPDAREATMKQVLSLHASLRKLP